MRSGCRRFGTGKSVPGADGGAFLPVTATRTCMLFQKHCTETALEQLKDNNINIKRHEISQHNELF